MTIKPITFRTACDFIALHHRHHKPTVITMPVQCFTARVAESQKKWGMKK